MITVVIPRRSGFRDDFLKELFSFSAVSRVIFLDSEDSSAGSNDRLETIRCADFHSGSVWNEIVARLTTPYFLYLFSCDVRVDQRAVGRLLSVALDAGAAWVYANYAEMDETEICTHPVGHYQQGSIRDDFDFGPLLLIDTAAARDALKKYGEIPPYRWAGLYDLRLKISTDKELFYLPESLSTVVKTDVGGSGKAGDGHFSYVDPQNSDYQREMEEAATDHLKRIGAWLAPEFRDIPVADHPFPVEASVVIPVRNRARTIADAVKSALSQKTDFPFNVLVVDNHSTDGTTDILADIASLNLLLKVLVPKRKDLSIGGCWNQAVFSDYCGRYAVQLDSDDLYHDDGVLQRLVDFLRTENCALVVGSYTIVDADLHVIEPGLINHREWSESNGRNNLLRVNGIGAPRAFDTNLLRQIGFPDVGYGEDYAVALHLSRKYKVGRIYDSLYFCRRWEQNTDSVLTVEKNNLYNAYKDRLRTVEIKARQRMNGHFS
jgi:hypothetical protein